VSGLPARRDLPARQRQDARFQMAMPKPDFVITGSTRPDGSVRVIASRSLTYQQLTATYNYMQVPGEFLEAPYSIPASYDVELSSHMHDLVIIDAPGYAEAMSAVWEAWAQKDREQRQQEEQAALRERGWTHVGETEDSVQILAALPAGEDGEA
jgi:hypothetical protein